MKLVKKDTALLETETASPGGEKLEMRGENKIDPLFTIFEKHLYDFGDETEDSVEFVDKVAKDYMRFLSTHKVAVPGKWEKNILDEFRDQIRKMMIKKMYGCLSIEEYIVNNKSIIPEKRKIVRRKYKKLY